MKKLRLLLLTLVATSTALFGQAPTPSPADAASTPTYTYYPLFSKKWIENKNFQAALEGPIVSAIGQVRYSLNCSEAYDFDGYKNANDGLSSTTLNNRKKDAERALRCELLGFLVEVDRVAINIIGDPYVSYSDLSNMLILSLHWAQPFYEELENHLNLNWDYSTSTYSVSPSHEELQKIYTLLAQCEEGQLATLITAAHLTTDESAQYNAFRTLQSKIDSNDSITLSQFRFASLEYINVLLARRVSLANGTSATDGFDALNQKLLNLNLHAPDDSPTYNAAAVDSMTLSDAGCDMLKYELQVAPAIEWNL